MSAFAPLRYPKFAASFFSNVLSLAGTWMQTVAVGAYVANETGQNRWAALAAVAGFLPNGLLSVFGGVLSDKYNPRRLLILFNLLECIAASFTAFLMAADLDTPIRIIGCVFVISCFDALRIPSAQAILPQLIDRKHLPAAVGLGTAQFNLGRVLGPVLAGLAIRFGGYTFAFSLNAVSFLAPVIAYLFIRVTHSEPHDAHDSPFQRFRSGINAARASTSCRSAIGLIAIASGTIAPVFSFLAMRAHDLSENDPGKVNSITSVLTSAQGIGGVIGALSVPYLVRRLGRSRSLLTACVLSPLFVLGFAATESITVTALSIVLFGITYVSLASGTQAIIQIDSPQNFRGRILAIWLGVLGLCFPLGSLVIGFFADRFGLGASLAVAALAGGFVSTSYAWRHRYQFNSQAVEASVG